MAPADVGEARGAAGARDAPMPQAGDHDHHDDYAMDAERDPVARKRKADAVPSSPAEPGASS
eukprot:8155969-Alexandrium_andersonii.AAC.1